MFLQLKLVPCLSIEQDKTEKQIVTIVSAAAAKTKFIAVLALECLARVGDFACVGDRTCDRMCIRA